MTAAGREPKRPKGNYRCAFCGAVTWHWPDGLCSRCHKYYPETAGHALPTATADTGRAWAGAFIERTQRDDAEGDQ